jgi:plastocyanin
LKRSGRVILLGALVFELAFGLGPAQALRTAATEAQVVQIKAVGGGFNPHWSPDDITIKSGEVTFAVTNNASMDTDHFFAILNADGQKVAETNPKSDEVTCDWKGVSLGCGRTIHLGQTEQVTFKLNAGKYTYICFIHTASGRCLPGNVCLRQVGTLTVKD